MRSRLDVRELVSDSGSSAAAQPRGTENRSQRQLSARPQRPSDQRERRVVVSDSFCVTVYTRELPWFNDCRLEMRYEIKIDLLKAEA